MRVWTEDGRAVRWRLCAIRAVVVLAQAGTVGRAAVVLIGGGTGPRLLTEVGASADGWMPIGAVECIRAKLPELQLGCAKWRVAIPQFVADPVRHDSDPGKLEYYELLGSDEAVLWCPLAVAPTVLG